MLQSSPTSSLSNKDETRSTAETLSQLRVKICSVRFPSSSKLVDIFVIMEVDCKYTYRTEVIRRKNKNNSSSNSNSNSPSPSSNNATNNNLINISESFDALVTSNSKIKLRILTPTRLFNNHDIGQLQFTLKKILDDYSSSDQISSNEDPPSYSTQISFDNSNGIVDLIFYGSLIEQRHQQYQQTHSTASNTSENTDTTVATTTVEIPTVAEATATSAEQSNNVVVSRLSELQQKVNIFSSSSYQSSEWLHLLFFSLRSLVTSRM